MLDSLLVNYALAWAFASLCLGPLCYHLHQGPCDAKPQTSLASAQASVASALVYAIRLFL